MEYVKGISHTVGSLIETNDSDSSSDDNDDDSSVSTLAHNITSTNMCAVCLKSRETTLIFMPFNHANSCGNCSDTILQLCQTCLVCPSPFENAFRYSQIDLTFPKILYLIVSHSFLLFSSISFIIY